MMYQNPGAQMSAEEQSVHTQISSIPSEVPTSPMHKAKMINRRMVIILIAFGVLSVGLIACIVLLILQSVGTISIGPKQPQPQAMLHSTSILNIGLFGRTKAGGVDVHKYRLRNVNGMEVDVISFGGTITAIRVPDKNGNIADVTLGLDTLAEYENRTLNPFFGSLVGRFANRIKSGKFSIDGKDYQVTLNNNGNALHGGQRGFDQYVWKTKIENDHLSLSLVSPDGDQGFPGQVTVHVTIGLTRDNEVVINFKATTTKPTPINLTYHPYFNLAGQGKGNINDHDVTIHADSYVVATVPDLIPTGKKENVAGTLFDLRQPVRLGGRLGSIPGGGYDHNFNTRGPTGKKFVAKVYHSGTGRVMNVFTNQPGLQFYTGNFLDPNINTGKDGVRYERHGGFCMEAQNYPDAVNQPDFPDSVLRPGNVYQNQIGYQFSVQR